MTFFNAIYSKEPDKKKECCESLEPMLKLHWDNESKQMVKESLSYSDFLLKNSKTFKLILWINKRDKDEINHPLKVKNKDQEKAIIKGNFF